MPPRLYSGCAHNKRTFNGLLPNQRCQGIRGTGNHWLVGIPLTAICRYCFIPRGNGAIHMPSLQHQPVYAQLIHNTRTLLSQWVDRKCITNIIKELSILFSTTDTAITEVRQNSSIREHGRGNVRDSSVSTAVHLIGEMSWCFRLRFCSAESPHAPASMTHKQM